MKSEFRKVGGTHFLVVEPLIILYNGVNVQSTPLRRDRLCPLIDWIFPVIRTLHPVPWFSRIIPRKTRKIRGGTSTEKNSSASAFIAAEFMSASISTNPGPLTKDIVQNVFDP